MSYSRSLPAALFSLLLIPASHSAPAPQQLQHPNHKIALESNKYVPYRPELTRDDPNWLRNQAAAEESQQAMAARKEDPEEVSNARADDFGDDVNQNQIMNEISNIIQQNNQKMSQIARHNVPETPVLNENLQNRAAPILNEQDPNNAEQFEQLPRVNERIPVVNREIIKVPNIRQRIPVVNQEGIVYNAPKVHPRVPYQSQHDALDTKQHIENELKKIKLNDLEDETNVNAVVANLDTDMVRNGAKPGVHAPKIVAESIGDNFRPDLGPDDSKWPMYDAKQDNIMNYGGDHQVQSERVKGEAVESGAQRVLAVHPEQQDLIDHHHQGHHLHRGADMVVKAAKAS